MPPSSSQLRRLAEDCIFEVSHRLEPLLAKGARSCREEQGKRRGAEGDLPSADILIHSGDVARVGSDAELGDFNDCLSDGAVEDPAYFQSKLTNARVLNHDLAEVMGLKIWGAGWHARTLPTSVRMVAFAVLTMLIVVILLLVLLFPPLLLQLPRFRIFDLTGGGHWGSSRALLEAIYRVKPKVHLFGHIHEQRGHWTKRAGGGFDGGVQYRPNPDSRDVFRPNGPPAADYPVEVESNNAMANQPVVDHSWTGPVSHRQRFKRGLRCVWAPQHIVGRPRLIIATQQDDGWHFASEE
eukprot:s2443_g7.t1